MRASNYLVPVLIPTFNNPTLLRNMLDQLQSRGFSNVTVLDNASTFPPMVELLDSVSGAVQVRRFRKNLGPTAVLKDRHLWDSLPRVFCLTDPDLELNPDTPDDFIDTLLHLSEKYQKGKVGLALDIADRSALKDDDFLINDRKYKIWEWEQRFWENPLEQDVYEAQVDTTFALYNKEFHDPGNHLEALRVAGPFTCQHLPWRRDFSIPTDELEFYRSANKHSFYLPNTRSGPPGLRRTPRRIASAGRQKVRTWLDRDS